MNRIEKSIVKIRIKSRMSEVVFVFVFVDELAMTARYKSSDQKTVPERVKVQKRNVCSLCRGLEVQRREINGRTSGRSEHAACPSRDVIHRVNPSDDFSCFRDFSGRSFPVDAFLSCEGSSNERETLH